MKKLATISNQIQNNTFSYTGKGSFEAIVNQHKESVVAWLEELIPLQKQIEMLRDLEGVEFQKRNYTRILSKLMPDEYTEFVSLNILVRDSNVIAQYYDEEYNVTILYDNLVRDKYLKYPGKYEKFVGYNIFQKFIMMYKDDLLKALEADTQDEIVKKETPQIVEENVNEKPIEQKEQEKTEEVVEEEVISPAKEKETNWTNLLLGRK